MTSFYEPPIPDDEEARLASVRQLDLEEGEPDEVLRDLVRVAAALCGTPEAYLTIITSDRQRLFASIESPTALDGGTRGEAFCAHGIMEPDEVMMVPDAKEDIVFGEHPLVVGDGGVRFYAGMPLSPLGFPVGSLCVVDDTPHELDEHIVDALRSLARIAEELLRLRGAPDAGGAGTPPTP